MEIRADYSQQYLLPRGIEDWVAENHPARFIRDFVESLDMKGLGFKTRKVEQGRPNYSSELLLTVWLYGYMEGIRSSRDLEKACMNQMGLIWLTGCNYPDHNTLWRFFRDYKDNWEKVFKRSVRVAQEVGLVGLVLHAVNGTKIPSVASNRQALHKEELTELLRELDESIEKMLSEVEDREVKEEGEYLLTEELQDVEKRRTAIQEALKNLEKEDKRHHNPVEPVFGWIKQGMGFRRRTVMGMANVQAQWALLCLTVNLKKLLPHWLEGRMALV
jgi:transposase